MTYRDGCGLRLFDLHHRGYLHWSVGVYVNARAAEVEPSALKVEFLDGRKL
jgi:hypothetical protein